MISRNDNDSQKRNDDKAKDHGMDGRERFTEGMFPTSRLQVRRTAETLLIRLGGVTTD